MADDEAIATFLEVFDLGDEALVDGEARLWFREVRDGTAVFAVADGENVDGADLKAIAERAMAALREAVADCDACGLSLEEQ